MRHKPTRAIATAAAVLQRCIIAICLLAPSVHAGYVVPREVVANGGLNASSSTSFRLYDTVGQGTAGKYRASPNYQLWDGFWKLIIVNPSSGPDNPPADIPEILSISSLGPNPCSNRLQLRLGVPDASRVNVRLYGVDGRFVRDIFDQTLTAGWHELAWDGLNSHHTQVGSGVYFLRAICTTGSAVRKVIVIN